MNEKKHTISLYKPATYRIVVPGHLDESWQDWAAEMKVTHGADGEGLPITTLTGSLDQAALLGLLRRLYSLGLPLISIEFLGGNEQMV